MVSIDRYLAICKPMTYTAWKSSRKAFILILCLWVFAFSSFIVPPLTKSDFIYYRFDKDENICGLFWEYKWFCILTAVYIPVLSGSLLVFTNVKIIQTIITRKQDLDKMNCQRSIRSRGMSAIKLLLTTSSIYFLAWGPYVVEVLLTSFIEGFRAPSMLKFALLWLANSNSFMNVVTFSFVYRAFRHDIKRLFVICLCRCTCITRVCQTGNTGINYTSDNFSASEPVAKDNELSTISVTRNVTCTAMINEL